LMRGPLERALEQALGESVIEGRRLGGGDINDAYEVRLASGRSVFVKTNAPDLAGMFEAEARGLGWLAEARALRVPEVIAVGGGDGQPAYLALEYLGVGRPQADHDVRLGRGLASLHRFGAPSFGLDHDNYIGRLPQSNRSAGTRAARSWPDFYREQRLEAQLRLAERRELASPRMLRGFAKLLEKLEALVGPAEPPARLHGDLWGGNLHTDEVGAPCLIDPAVYGGHREVDLAMMRLFGGFGARVFDAYREAYPLAEGHEDRVLLYQLYPLLVHVNHFGGGYVRSVEGALARYV